MPAGPSFSAAGAQLYPEEPDETALHTYGQAWQGRKIPLHLINNSVGCSNAPLSPSLQTLPGRSMEREDGHGGWQRSSQTLVVSATLQPPKRSGESLVMQRGSPKRLYPSPSPDAGPNSPISRPKSAAQLCTDIDSISAYSPSPQNALLQMDWTPTSGPIVETDNNAEHDYLEESEPRVCYRTVRNSLLPSL